MQMTTEYTDDMRELDDTINDVLAKTQDIGKALLILRDKLSPDDFANFQASLRHPPAHRDAAKVMWRLRSAFKQLRAQGYITRWGRWICCPSCGHAAMGRLSVDKYVFWHDQSHDNLIQDAGVWLNWSGDGAEIVAACEAAGLKVEWEGTEQKSIGVRMPLMN
jgi:hypothetical protein